MALPTGGMISGQGFFFKLSDNPSEDMIANKAMYGSVSSHIKEGFGDHYSKVWQTLYDFVEETLFYQKNESNYAKGNLRELKFDAEELAAFQPVLAGKIPLILAADSFDEIANLLRFVKTMQKKKLNLKVVLFGATESWMHADELKKLNIPVILNATNQTVYSFSHMQNRDDLAAALSEKGVEIALTAHDWSTYPQRIRQSAGMAVANGLPYEKAFAAITGNPVKIYGLDKNVATLNQGQSATFILWNADPLEPLATPVRIWIDGNEVNLDNRQRMLARKYL